MGRRRRKNTPNFSQSTKQKTSSQFIDIAQDSDKKNSKIKNKQHDNPDFDHLEDFFLSHFVTIKVSGSSFSSLCTHFDGSCQGGRIENKYSIILLFCVSYRIPWNLADDPYLQAEFYYCEQVPGFSSKIGLPLVEKTFSWSYRKQFLIDLKKFNLINEIWTTKGGFCGFISLVINSGFDELGLKAPPPPKLNKFFQGDFPYFRTMKRIEE
ncbi:hypothetical protein VP01_2852g1 [Puccinia sorghi]|uniref:Uncharacterized protein n=1 Tax=Puccinia sorghi TaxID=27349 RepID=A0A0L6V207_9BASI|nr:hypothetical protein VP01_2852g1 [Puccinia sorghi]